MEEEQFSYSQILFFYFTGSSITGKAIALLCSKNSESKGKNFPLGLPPFLCSKL